MTVNFTAVILGVKLQNQPDIYKVYCQKSNEINQLA